MTRCIALLRGINVGTARRIAMADLRALTEELGGSGVRTILNSGNVVFDLPRPGLRAVAASITDAISTRYGFTVPVVVVSARHLEDIVAEGDPDLAARDPSKYLVAFAASPAALAAAAPLCSASWDPEALTVGSRAAYLWCARGVADSPLASAFSRATDDACTTRNWTTVGKLHVAALGTTSSGPTP